MKYQKIHFAEKNHIKLAIIGGAFTVLGILGAVGIEYFSWGVYMFVPAFFLFFAAALTYQRTHQ
ncbi:MAG: hypothetical protein ACTSYQ_03005, partial [Candidatus Odinarchaeia archaeon]